MPDKLTDAEIEAAIALAEKATPGPWEAIEGGMFREDGKPFRDGKADVQSVATWQPKYKHGPRKGQPKGNPRHEPIAWGWIFPAADLKDAEFIAAARTLLPAALRELQAARRQLAKVGESGAANELRELRERIVALSEELHADVSAFSGTRTQERRDIAARLRELGESR